MPVDTLADLLGREMTPTALEEAAQLAAGLSDGDLVGLVERLPAARASVLLQTLDEGRALAVFASLDAPHQAVLVDALQESYAVGLFVAMDPDDQVSLLDELSPDLAEHFLAQLDPRARALTSLVRAYPRQSIGRRMSPEVVSVPMTDSVDEALARVRLRLQDAETVYTLPVVDEGRVLVGVLGLRRLLATDPDTPVAEIMRPVESAVVTEDAERTARRFLDRKLLGMPIVDADHRLVGIVTVDDALVITEEADSQDHARQGGTEALGRPYLSTAVGDLVRSRIVWLLVLAVSAALTVQVLEIFEATLTEVVVLALFIPLLTGTGGNTGNQAATTITRALALGDVTPRDISRVLLREARVGALLGALLGSLAFLVAGAVYGVQIGLVIGLTLLSVCTIAATVGGAMPIIAQKLRADPAVFSNPFISTFTDATGLVVYFLIARAVLQL
ncbi:magnesium transporter [Ornithinimicrobium ciconiae]|uniref:Magnesium transporter MgtE n=1 Tax=Ornithinimicrobium ciconiae TaxID=2594265 RepID=A0A516GC21_9MICO|nr:magnesium transporter [Ornithinimicrobium ciconiae]QDO89069.1 magnesium transporter [Ornithinimicrobium ciconiae]